MFGLYIRVFATIMSQLSFPTESITQHIAAILAKLCKYSLSMIPSIENSLCYNKL